MKKIDMPRLKLALSIATDDCRSASKMFKSINRQNSTGVKSGLSPRMAALDVDLAKWRMTKLCIFRAHLRGRKHITRSAFPVDRATVIREMSQEFRLV